MNEDHYNIDDEPCSCPECWNEDFHDDTHPEWDGNYPDASNEENYDSEDDTWSDADTLTSIGWGTDEDYGYYGEDS